MKSCLRLEKITVLRQGDRQIIKGKEVLYSSLESYLTDEETLPEPLVVSVV
jgi:hypothetical protein